MDSQTRGIFTNIERGFDVAACIPVVAIASGSLLAVAGKTQAFAGAVIAAIGALGHHLSKNPKWEAMMKTGFEFIAHGGLNVIKGVTQAAIGSSLIGSPLVFIPFYLAKEAKAIPSFNYGAFNDLKFCSA